MATHGEDLQTAYAEGAKKSFNGSADGSVDYGAAVVDKHGVQAAGTIIPHDELLVPVNIWALKSGQEVSGRGTTIFNPKRNSIEVESVFGELKYPRKKAGDTPEHTKAEQIKLQNQVKEMAAQIEILTAALGAKAQREIKAEKEEMIDELPEAVQLDEVDDSEDKDYDNMSMAELRVAAERMGVKPMGTSKAGIAKQLKEAS